MLDPRGTRPVLVVVAALALLGPSLPAHAGPSDPSPSQISAAHRAVASAQESFANIQVQAEKAAEVYNGALTRAHAARRSAALAASRAAAASAAEAQAQGVAAGARVASDAAQAASDQAAGEQQAAADGVVASQLALNQMAVGVYTNGGQLGYLSQLVSTSDPAQFSRGQAYVNRVGRYQQSVIVDLTAARTKAAFAAEVAKAASAKAASLLLAAQNALDQVSATADAARAARTTAQQAASSSLHALAQAALAKSRALRLVARAEHALGNAKQRARHLELAAAQARAEARFVKTGVAPSDAAGVAMSWAFQEIGVPYSWGGGDENGPTYGFAQGAGTRGFDCSGLTLFAYAHAGIHLDHFTGSQWNEGQRVSSRADLLPGDLMFFAYDTGDPATIHHVSIYIGNGQMIEAPFTGSVVRVSSADRGDFIGGTRPWA